MSLCEILSYVGLCEPDNMPTGKGLPYPLQTAQGLPPTYAGPVPATQVTAFETPPQLVGGGMGPLRDPNTTLPSEAPTLWADAIAELTRLKDATVDLFTSGSETAAHAVSGAATTARSILGGSFGTGAQLESNPIQRGLDSVQSTARLAAIGIGGIVLLVLLVRR